MRVCNLIESAVPQETIANLPLEILSGAKIMFLFHFANFLTVLPDEVYLRGGRLHIINGTVKEIGACKYDIDWVTGRLPTESWHQTFKLDRGYALKIDGRAGSVFNEEVFRLFTITASIECGQNRPLLLSLSTFGQSGDCLDQSANSATRQKAPVNLNTMEINIPNKPPKIEFDFNRWQGNPRRALIDIGNLAIMRHVTDIPFIFTGSCPPFNPIPDQTASAVRRFVNGKLNFAALAEKISNS